MGSAADENAVLDAADRIVDAFAATDTAAYFGGFHPDTTFVFYTEPQTLANRAEYEHLWGSWVSEGWRVVSCRSSERVVAVVGDTGVFSHTVDTVTEVGGEQTSTHERESIIFARLAGEWIAVHEHLAAATPPAAD